MAKQKDSNENTNIMEALLVELRVLTYYKAKERGVGVKRHVKNRKTIAESMGIRGFYEGAYVEKKSTFKHVDVQVKMDEPKPTEPEVHYEELKEGEENPVVEDKHINEGEQIIN